MTSNLKDIRYLPPNILKADLRAALIRMLFHSCSLPLAPKYWVHMGCSKWGAYLAKMNSCSFLSNPVTSDIA